MIWCVPCHCWEGRRAAPGYSPNQNLPSPHRCWICISLEEMTLQSHFFTIAKLFGDELSVKHFQGKNSQFIAFFLPRSKSLIWQLWKKKTPQTNWSIWSKSIVGVRYTVFNLFTMWPNIWFKLSCVICIEWRPGGVVQAFVTSRFNCKIALSLGFQWGWSINHSFSDYNSFLSAL